jgi:hypothetical protein
MLASLRVAKQREVPLDALASCAGIVRRHRAPASSAA